MRRTQVYLSSEDVLARLIGLTEGEYECVVVNNSWPDKALLEGDVILFTEGQDATSGDIVLIEEEGSTRLGLVSQPGMLETRYGRRPLEASERIVGIGMALIRKLKKI
jgi:SOS-response transcriptional repressor LexA